MQKAGTTAAIDTMQIRIAIAMSTFILMLIPPLFFSGSIPTVRRKDPTEYIYNYKLYLM